MGITGTRECWGVLESVVNVSEGRNIDLLDNWRSQLGESCLDVHHDQFHHRSVFTVIGEFAPRQLTRLAVGSLNLTAHSGVHPRIGVVDVVPFVPLHGSTMTEAIGARDRFARWAARELNIPCFVYGPERSLPDLRRSAFVGLAPDTGPILPHPTAGALAVGARGVLVAYNLWLRTDNLAVAQSIARTIRSDRVRTLGLAVGSQVQVSCNLLEPERFGPSHAFDAVAALADIDRAELVGLIPASVLGLIASHRWAELDLGPDRTIESRLADSLRRSQR